MESGYITLQCDELGLALRKVPAKDLTLRLDAEFVNGYNVFKWTNNGEVKYSSSKFTPVLQATENAGADENATFNFINGFDNLVLKSNFVDLSGEVMSGLANTSLKVVIVQINDSVEAAPAAKPAKGAPPPVAQPSEEALLSLTIPLSSLLQASGGVIQVAGTYADSVVHATIEGAQSYLNFTLSADNNLAEYVMGSRMLSWSGASLLNAPASWGLHFADVIDPKAKVPATAEELRKKYLEGISKLMETQEKVASFQLTVGGEGAPPASEEETTNTADRSVVQQMIVKQELSSGVLSFDKEAAANVPVTEDIRALSELWSIAWGPSACIFLHRADVRKLIALLEKDPSNGVLPLTIKKSPTNEFMAAEGGELFATALVDISTILQPDSRSWSIVVPVTGVDFTEAVPYELTVSLSSTGVLRPKAALQALADKIAASNNTFAYGNGAGGAGVSDAPTVAAKTVSTVDNNKSALEILRSDITKAIERVAQEYLTLYPIADEKRQAEEGAAVSKTLDGKKIEFLNYLTANGIFNELKEHLKTSVELIIREQYGDRGRAISAGLTVGSEFNATEDLSSGAKLEAVLSELYVFLMKECSVVLNSLFSDTLIDRQKSELEVTASIRDEEETILQHLSRLSNQADDCTADLQFSAAESLHLECIHHINHHPSLGSNLQVVHEVYSRYGDFLLTFYATLLRNGDASMSSDFLDGILQRARDALYSAVCSNTSNWRVALLYSAVLVEVNQQEQAEGVLHQVLSSQLAEGKYTMNSFSEFDGYETDKICPVDPRCYSVLAGLFSLQGLTLKCRKALRLANRSFAEGGFEPPLSTHGTPRRTLVLTLSDTAIHLLSFGLRKLGDACLRLAQQCESDVTEKAVARGKSATTVPHIKHLLRRADAMSLVLNRGSADGSNSNSNNEEARAMESVLCAEEPEDLLRGWLTVASAVNPQDGGKLIEAYLSAVERLGDIPISTPKKDLFPLSAFVHLGKLLVTSGRWKEASTVLLYGATFYSSACLFLLLGVCYLRLDQQAEAEEAFMASSTLNNKAPELWAYFCLLNLAVGSTRHVEAERCMLQSLRLGLTDVLLLREMATAYIAVDKLQTAEDLIRRALVTDKRSALTRRLLGDVLAGQNQAVRAIDEYQAILSEEGGAVDDVLKLETAEKCANLLISIGRDDDVKTLRNIMASIVQQ